jgi:hypothetical protein
VTIAWRRLSGNVLPIGTVQTDGAGAASGQFRVPATPGGPNQQITFVSGNVSKTVTFEVAPRIKILDSLAVRGQFVNVSLRGYAKSETVRIRWQQGARWITLATVLTSNTGSANVSVQVPTWAPNGFNSVRGDGTVFRQQTNTVYVQGGPYTPAALSHQIFARPPMPIDINQSSAPPGNEFQGSAGSQAGSTDYPIDSVARFEARSFASNDPHSTTLKAPSAVLSTPEPLFARHPR